VNPAAAEFDEEQHVDAAERDRLDGEEVASKRGRCLLAEELSPTRTRTPRRWLKTSGQSSRRTVLGETRRPSFSNSPAILG
jgi:hypothetical protein